MQAQEQSGEQLSQSYDANNDRQSAEWQHDSHDRLLHSSALARPLPNGTRSYRTDALGRRVQILHNGAVESTLLYSTGLLPIAAPEDYLSPTILVFDGAQQCPKV